MREIIKLSNGEDIIGEISEEDETHVLISFPLKFAITTRPTEAGMRESVTLTRWLEPMSNDVDIEINKQYVIVRANASSGMDQFYESTVEQVYMVSPELRESISSFDAEEDEGFDLFEEPEVLEPEDGIIH